jgi:hypothetical protein
VAFVPCITFAVREGKIQGKSPELNSPLTEKRVRGAIVARLTALGLKEASEKPDVWVAFMLGARETREVDTFAGERFGRRTRRVVHQVTAGSLVIDLYDSKTKELVWRAVCSDTVSDPGKFEERLPKDVAKAFEKYPPKKK